MSNLWIVSGQREISQGHRNRGKTEMDKSLKKANITLDKIKVIFWYSMCLSKKNITPL